MTSATNMGPLTTELNTKRKKTKQFYERMFLTLL